MLDGKRKPLPLGRGSSKIILSYDSKGNISKKNG